MLPETVPRSTPGPRRHLLTVLLTVVSLLAVPLGALLVLASTPGTVKADHALGTANLLRFTATMQRYQACKGLKGHALRDCKRQIRASVQRFHH